MAYAGVERHAALYIEGTHRAGGSVSRETLGLWVLYIGRISRGVLDLVYGQYLQSGVLVPKTQGPSLDRMVRWGVCRVPQSFVSVPRKSRSSSTKVQVKSDTTYWCINPVILATTSQDINLRLHLLTGFWLILCDFAVTRRN